MRAGLAHGHGIYVWPGGHRYEGDRRDGDRDGRGVYVWANGDRYEGPFGDGVMHGTGICSDADGQSSPCEWSYGEYNRRSD
jgi:hypothetical protein